jgi:predicted DNA-binding transcriptional regulator YafY
MTDVIKMNQTFREEMMDKENYFKATIGISLPNTSPEKIVLRFDPLQRNYLMSQPLHHSQQIVKDTKKEFTISVELVINYELNSLLLSFGEKVKILKPAHLASTISETIKKMAALYAPLFANFLKLDTSLFRHAARLLFILLHTYKPCHDRTI